MIKKRYYWKELTGDGLMKQPPKHGSYYSSDSRLQDESFETEQEAIELLEDYMKCNDLTYWFADMVLVPMYEYEQEKT
ncbi:MAG: hypothetical protein WC679_01430 [Bacteroidales bacterium]|jgi:hypothetical protein